MLSTLTGMAAPTTWPKRDGTFLFVLLLIAFAVRLAWACLIPYNDAPDEYMHVRLVKFVSLRQHCLAPPPPICHPWCRPRRAARLGRVTRPSGL